MVIEEHLTARAEAGEAILADATEGIVEALGDFILHLVPIEERAKMIATA